MGTKSNESLDKTDEKKEKKGKRSKSEEALDTKKDGGFDKDNRKSVMQKSFFGKKKEEKAEDKDDGKKKLGLFNKSKRDLSPSPEGSEDGKEEKGGFFAKRKGSFSAKIKSDDNPADSEQKEKRSPFSLRKDPNRDSKKSLANVAVALMAKKKEDKMEEETIGVAPKESLNT